MRCDDKIERGRTCLRCGKYYYGGNEHLNCPARRKRTASSRSIDDILLTPVPPREPNTVEGRFVLRR